MKIIIGVVLLFVFACSDKQKKKSPTAHTPILIDTPIQPLLKIGGCYVYQATKDSLIGLTLIKIFRELDVDYYTFLLSGNIFRNVPDRNVFRKAGVWGRKIPEEPNPKVDFFIGLNTYTMSKDLVAASLSKLKLIDSFAVSQNIISGSNGFYTFDRLQQEFEFIKIQNKKAPTNDILPSYPVEVYPFSGIPVAKNNAERSVPVTVWRLSQKTIHPKALELIKEDWLWAEAEDFSPFGNDDGSDALYGFREWRLTHPGDEPADYLHELEQDWGMSFSYLEIESEKKLPEVAKLYPFYRNTDRAIVAVCFAQLVLEGTVSPKLKKLGIKALKRANTAFGMEGIPNEEYKKEYTERLGKMESILKNL